MNTPLSPAPVAPGLTRNVLNFRQIDWVNVVVWGAMASFNIWFWTLALRGFLNLLSAYWAGFTSF